MTETIGNFLKRKFHEWNGKNLSMGRGIQSQAEFAKWLGVSTTNLSNWMNDMRPPSSENADLLAEKLGMDVYDLLGLPRRMPRDKKLYFLATIWHALDHQAQDELYERGKNLAEGKEGNGNGGSVKV